MSRKRRTAMSTPLTPPPRRAKTFENEWILGILARRPGFRSKRMFGGLAGYVHDRIMLVLVEPTRTGRWQWSGVLLCTDHARQPAIVAEFPQLAPHDVLTKWLFLDARHDEFEEVMERIAHAMVRGDARFGVVGRRRAG
jgi:hypothetical protein